MYILHTQIQRDAWIVFPGRRAVASAATDPVELCGDPGRENLAVWFESFSKVMPKYYWLVVWLPFFIFP